MTRYVVEMFIFFWYIEFITIVVFVLMNVHKFPFPFQKDIAQRIPCGYATAVASAPRLQPWYSDEPTEEEIEAMKVR